MREGRGGGVMAHSPLRQQRDNVLDRKDFIRDPRCSAYQRASPPHSIRVARQPRATDSPSAPSFKRPVETAGGRRGSGGQKTERRRDACNINEPCPFFFFVSSQSQR